MSLENIKGGLEAFIIAMAKRPCFGERINSYEQMLIALSVRKGTPARMKPELLRELNLEFSELGIELKSEQLPGYLSSYYAALWCEYCRNINEYALESVYVTHGADDSIVLPAVLVGYQLTQRKLAESISDALLELVFKTSTDFSGFDLLHYSASKNRLSVEGEWHRRYYLTDNSECAWGDRMPRELLRLIARNNEFWAKYAKKLALEVDSYRVRSEAILDYCKASICRMFDCINLGQPSGAKQAKFLTSVLDLYSLTVNYIAVADALAHNFAYSDDQLKALSDRLGKNFDYELKGCFSAIEGALVAFNVGSNRAKTMDSGLKTTEPNLVQLHLIREGSSAWLMWQYLGYIDKGSNDVKFLKNLLSEKSKKFIEPMLSYFKLILGRESDYLVHHSGSCSLINPGKDKSCLRYQELITAQVWLLRILAAASAAHRILYTLEPNEYNIKQQLEFFEHVLDASALVLDCPDKTDVSLVTISLLESAKTILDNFMHFEYCASLYRLPAYQAIMRDKGDDKSAKLCATLVASYHLGENEIGKAIGLNRRRCGFYTKLSQLLSDSKTDIRSITPTELGATNDAIMEAIGKIIDALLGKDAVQKT